MSSILRGCLRPVMTDIVEKHQLVSLVDGAVGGAVTRVEFGPSRRPRQPQQRDSKGGYGHRSWHPGERLPRLAGASVATQ